MRFISFSVYRAFKPYLFPFAVWAIIAVGMWLRINRADEFPVYQNDDGLFYVWAGNSIFDNFFHPTSLTIFETNNQNMFWRSQYRNTVPAEQFGVRLSDPWFDHPFLSTLFISLPARYFGYYDFSQIPHMLVRTPALIMSFFTLIFTYLLSSRLFSKRVGLFSLAVLALWPLAVFSSRQSYIENIMTPIWLASLLLTWKVTNGQSRKWYFPLLILCDVCLAWSKIIGYISFVITAYWFGHANQKKRMLIILAAGGISLGVYLLYGNWIGGSYFWQTILNQGGRGAYLSSIFQILASPQIYGTLEDGWWYLAWFGLLWVTKSKEKSNRYLVMNVVWWMLALFFLCGPQNNSPWYRYPMYPLLAIGAANLLDDWWQSPNLIFSGIFLMLGLTGYRIANIGVSSNIIRLGIIACIGAFAIVQLYIPKSWQKSLNRLLIGLWAVAAVYGNMQAVKRYPDIICKDHNCATPVKIDVTKPNL